MRSLMPGTLGLTALALIAFAANSILCRLALADPMLDALSFTVIRLGSGAVVLSLLIIRRIGNGVWMAPRWISAFALFLYAASFSLAYLRIPAGFGALILFGSVQVTMVGRDMFNGNRPKPAEWMGFGLAIGGLASLTLPGVEAPDFHGVLLMALSGLAWGIYSLKGRGVADPIGATAANFLWSLVFAIPVFLSVLGVYPESFFLSAPGVALGVLSGGLTSAIGYVIWYRALRGLTATRAAIVQLLVPVITALAGVLLLGENLSIRLLFSGIVILFGVALAVLHPQVKRSSGRLNTGE